MLFTSLDFLLFLPLALALHGALPPRRRWIGMLLASCVFYGWSRPSNLLLLGAVTLVTIAAGTALRDAQDLLARRAILGAGLALVLGALAALKFHDFGFATPAGFSFYAFCAASFIIDSYRREAPADASAGEVALYLAWFPKILAGPIERSTRFLPQLRDGLLADPGRVVLGSQLVLWGLVKKVLIADNLAPVVDRAFGIVAYASPVELAMSVYFFAFQIYCDFSGYTDIAIGLSLLFGIQLMENFRRPYFSRSSAEFWGERWHISLGRWFRDYLYIPLGGSRAGAVRRYLNVMIVFVASGFWHAGLGYGVGWTFVVWGAINGAYLWTGIASAPLWRRAASRFPRVASSAAWTVLRVLVTFHLVAFAWIFFRARSIADAWTVVRRIGANAVQLVELLPNYPFTTEHYTGFALIATLLAIELADERRSIFRRLAEAPATLRWASCYAAIFALLLLGRWQAKEFIYMQF
ncbi:MAG TPA: MBOAT family O-acyltransferase [Usitatibacter sp.]